MQKEKTISLRLTKEDYETINKNANDLKMSQSEYMRNVSTSRLCRLAIKLTRRK